MSVVDRNVALQEKLKSWPLIGRAKIISTNERSFALASQPFKKVKPDTSRGFEAQNLTHHHHHFKEFIQFCVSKYLKPLMPQSIKVSLLSKIRDFFRHF